MSAATAFARPRIFVVPRWGANTDDDFYPWLRRELGDCEVTLVPLRPHARAPAIDASVAELAARVDTAPPALGRTVLVGHSVGCQVALRFAARLPATAALPAIVAVAGWWSLPGAWPSLRPWIDTPIDSARVRSVARRIEVLLADRDPHLGDIGAQAAAWQLELGATVTIVPGAGHFNRSREPAVLRAVRAALPQPAATER